MNVYKCSLCGKEMPRDILKYKKHIEQHVVEEIEKQHPEWKTEDGVCLQCLNYYQNQIRGNG